MAAVTITSVRHAVSGSLRVNYYTFNAVSGETLDVPFRAVWDISSPHAPKPITGISIASISGGSRLTTVGLRLTISGR